MKRLLLATSLFAAGFFQKLSGQKPEYIHIEASGAQFDKSIFSQVEVVDTRFDTVYMGFVQKGTFNRKAPIRLTQPLTVELKESVALALGNAGRQPGTILINVRNFFLSELTTAMSESGTFIFKAGCYWKHDSSYGLMFSVDTTIVVKALDVTKKLLRTANHQFGSFVQRAASFDLAERPPGTIYSFGDIQNIDGVEKRALPVYNVDLPQRGLYARFDDFKNNRPSDTSFITEVSKKTGDLSFFRANSDGTRGHELSRKDYYAICDGSKLFISTQYGIYRVQKKDLDFHFIGKGKETANAATVATASLMFGLLGGMLASIPETAMFEFKIDHSTGKFLPLKKISD